MAFTFSSGVPVTVQYILTGTGGDDAATLSAKQLALNDVYGRLVQVLSGLAVEQPGGTRLIEERLTHQALAHRLGCSREMVSRLMKDLEHGDYVEARDGRLVLLRPLPSRW